MAITFKTFDQSFEIWCTTWNTQGLQPAILKFSKNPRWQPQQPSWICENMITFKPFDRSFLKFGGPLQTHKGYDLQF
jgi:hypothetical protein